MPEDKKRQAKENSFPKDLTRRETLSKAGALSAVGIAGMTGFSGNVAADHGCGWEESVGIVETVDNGYFRMGSETDLCWHSWDSTERRHYFRMVTAASAEYPKDSALNQGPIEAIAKHEITIDACTDELTPDISENETGTNPPEGTNEVDTDFGDLASVATAGVSGMLKFGGAVTALEGAKETMDILNGDSNCAGHSSTWKVDRVSDKSIKREEAVTTQCEFAVELPTGTSEGNFILDSYTYAGDHKYNYDPSYIETTNTFQVSVADDGSCSLIWYTSSSDSGTNP